jgi:hypothetical protein
MDERRGVIVASIARKRDAAAIPRVPARAAPSAVVSVAPVEADSGDIAMNGAVFHPPDRVIVSDHVKAATAAAVASGGAGHRAGKG